MPESVVNLTAKDGPFNVQAPVLSGFYTFGGHTTAVVSGSYDFENSAGNQTDLRLNLFAGDAVELWGRALAPGTLNARTLPTCPISSPANVGGKTGCSKFPPSPNLNA